MIPEYACGEDVRQRFTGKERDGETGLDYFGARYLSSAQGRFTSPDPMSAGAEVASPQSWNGYTYVLNNPLRLVDPDGRAPYPAESFKANYALLRDPMLARVLWTANNYSPAAFERGVRTGELLGRDGMASSSGMKLVGLAGEAVVADAAGGSWVNDLLNGDIGVQTGPKEIGGIAPDLRLNLNENTRFVAENVVGQTGGLLVSNAKFVDIQVKVTTSASYIGQGAAQTVRNADAIAGRGGVAVMAIDRKAWSGLNGKQQASILNTLARAKGGNAYIQLFDNLNEDARKRAQGLVDRAR